MNFRISQKIQIVKLVLLIFLTVIIYELYVMMNLLPPDEMEIIEEDDAIEFTKNKEKFKSDECIYQVYSEKYSPNTSKEFDITIVTAFFDIGPFEKGSNDTVFTSSLYEKWMSIFEYLDNPLYVYVDSVKYQKLFEKIRRNSRNKTKILLIERKSTWGFNLRESISDIFSNPNYPKHTPNTMIPNYSCAMHAKFDVMLKSVNDNKFQTKYFAWIDVGYYRELVSYINKPFKIYLPPCFDDSRVSYSEMYTPQERTLKQIIVNQDVWVAGGLFFAERIVMRKWVEDYMHYTEKFIQLGWISTDQQVIYAMRQPSIHKKLGKRRVAIQEYRVNYIQGYWFGLGYLCRKDL